MNQLPAFIGGLLDGVALGWAIAMRVNLHRARKAAAQIQATAK